MKSCLSILCLLIYLSSFSQKKEFNVQKKYTVAQALKDIDYTEKYLTKFHPDPYKYISKDSLHAFIEKTKAKIDSPLTEMQLRFYIKRIVAKIGCGHTDVAASKQYTKALKKFNRPLLPINAFALDSNKLFILNNLSTDTTIKTGDEILSIDHHSTQHILNSIFSVYTSDGYNETYKKQGTRYNWFKYYYSFCYGYKLQYQLTVKHKDRSVTNYTLNALSSKKDTVILPKKDSVAYLIKTKTCKYSILDSSKSIAVIDIDGFKGRHWYRFFRRSFKDIEDKKIKHLVIDLRDNGGGQIHEGLKFLSYIIHENLFLPFDRKPNLLALNPRYKMDLASRFAPFAFCTMMPQRPKNGRLRHYFVTFPKKMHAFKGQVYVLTNGKSFSMSAVAASYLKYKANATVVGEETGGNVAGSNAVISGKIILPNSRIQILIPMYHIYHDIEVKNDGHGIMPNYHTKYSKEDVLNGVDLDLIKVLELVE